MLRKINSILTVPIFVLFAVHLILMSGLLTGFVGFNPDFKKIGFALAALVLVHSLFGIYFAFERIFLRKRGQKAYPKENKLFRFQLISGIVMLILVFLHTTAYGYTNAEGIFVLRDPSVFYYITECLLALFVCAHSAVSVPRMAITFGLIKEGKGLLNIVKVSTAVFALVFIFAVFIFSTYYLPSILGGIL
jgi:hypothetical protein